MLERSEKVIPEYNVPLNWKSADYNMARAYALLGQNEKARNICNKLWKGYSQYVEWYLSKEGDQFFASQPECLLYFQMMMTLSKVTQLFDAKLEKKQLDQLDAFYSRYMQKGGKPFQ